MKERTCDGFLIYDRSLNSTSAPFYQWLKSEGFTPHRLHGHTPLAPEGMDTSVHHCYIFPEEMTFSRGIMGVGLRPVIWNHAISIDEFKIIWGIYKKYQGKGVLVFS